MNNRTGKSGQVVKVLPVIGVLMVLCFPVSLLGAEALPTIRGSIQELGQDDGYITVSGRQVPFQNDITQVFLNGVEVDSVILEEGMVVRCTFNTDGILAKIEILGPVDKIRDLTNN